MRKKSPRQKFLEHMAIAMPKLNIRNLKMFAHRLAVEIDTMRGRVFDEIRDAPRVQFSPEKTDLMFSDLRSQKLHNANLALYRAHVALLEAQAELSK